MPRKIFPRNLTARAGYVVAGNPANSRPESGVDNCYPGLEFDQRNLEQRFYPGLVFYFHRDDGAMLIGTDPADRVIAANLAAYDCSRRPLYLCGMLGCQLVEDPVPSTISFHGQTGMQIWRRVHDLLPGTVALVLGPNPGAAAAFSPSIRNDLVRVFSAADGPQHVPQFIVQRDANGEIEHVVCANQRARYLDPEGVIEPQDYEPGDLTKTMCSPWMYDFRDCYCFYWSSSKPDIVNVPTENGAAEPYVNFLRRTADRGPQPPQDVNYFWTVADGALRRRRDLELTNKDMVEGWWQKLPVVIDDTESITSVAPAAPDNARNINRVAGKLDRTDIVAELRYLATVEHALTIEYLYAFYSLARNSSTDPQAFARIDAAAEQLYQIATDEMRHLMWANIALHLLDAPPSLGRAQRIAEPPDPQTNGRRPLDESIVYLNQPFELKPLDAATLEWFIRVEAPSKAVNEGLDGMYVYILEALRLNSATIANSDRLVPLIKLLVDEGQGHWQRFSQIKITLAGIPESQYLRTLNREPPGQQQLECLGICDAYYEVLLKAIEMSLTLREIDRARLVKAAVRLMRSLDDMARLVAQEGYLPRFQLMASLPGDSVSTVAGQVPRSGMAVRSSKLVMARAAPGKSFTSDRISNALAGLDDRYALLDERLMSLQQSGSGKTRIRASEHRQQLAQHIAEVDAILTQGMTEPEG